MIFMSEFFGRILPAKKKDSETFIVETPLEPTRISSGLDFSCISWNSERSCLMKLQGPVSFSCWGSKGVPYLYN